ncbi:MAG TPA: hypothetical protein VHA56_14340 [Mucilaginibacter sp.]|nr:hypothetical protein [Mucilaginibacter sp.]
MIPDQLPVAGSHNHNHLVGDLNNSECVAGTDAKNLSRLTATKAVKVNRFRLRSINKGKALPLATEARFNWRVVGNVLQAKYDKGHYLPHIPRCVKRTWRSVIKVRRELQKHGSDQRSLLRGREALSVTGVIYAIMAVGSQKLYVGQTVKSALARFQQHVSTARRGESTPLHVHIRQVGIHPFYLIPLEVIPPRMYTSANGKVDNKLFRSVASPREKFWIERLHSYQPRGYNVEWSGRNRHRHRTRSNPMKWAKNSSIYNKSKTVSANSDPLAPIMDDEMPLSPIGNVSNSSRRPDPMPALVNQGGRSDVNLTSYSSRQFGYRNWERRCRFLVQLFHKDACLLEKVNWNGYAPRNLWRMLSFLEKEKHDFEDAAVQFVIECIRSQLLIRTQSVSERRRKGRPVVSLEWTSQLLRATPLGVVLRSSESKSLFPADTSILDDVSVVRKLVKPLGRTMFNYSKVARNLGDAEGNADSCTCRRLFKQAFRPGDGCVLTGDAHIVESSNLRRLIMLGPKVRTHVAADPMEAISIALDSFVSMVSGSEAIDKIAFTAWKHAVLNACKARLEAANVHGGYGSKDRVVLGKKDLKYLSFLQAHLVLVPVDKAANNVAFICRRKYTDILRYELDSNPTQSENSAYEISEEGAEVVIARHVYRLKSFYRFTEVPERLGYLYWMPKLHKVPCSQRFIAAAFACTTTQLSKLLSDCLTKVLATLREKDNANILRTGVRRFFVVSGYEEVVAFLSRWPRKNRSGFKQLITGDFSTMYTAIPHQDLIEKVSIVLNEVWEWVSKSRDVDPVAGQHHERITLRWARGEDNVCEWDVTRARSAMFEHTDSLHRFTKSELNTAVQWLIQNTFLVNGSTCRRQRVGIPMGTNCGPALANLYLYAYESAYIDKLAKHSLVQAAEFHMTFRLIDDVLSIDNRYMAVAIEEPCENGGMYPAALALNDTSVSPVEVRFLGMSIIDDDGKLCFNVFDKRREFPFIVCRYPHRSSLIPAYIAYAVFTGLLHRYYRICTQFEHFCWNASLLARTLVRQGWQLSRLRSIFRRFLQSRLALKWKLSFSQMCGKFARESEQADD